MAQTMLSDTEVQSALRRSVDALARMADYTLPAALDRRLLELGERKEFLGEAEHEELMALVAFTHDRTIEKLQAQIVLRELKRLLPDEGQP